MRPEVLIRFPYTNVRDDVLVRVGSMSSSFTKSWEMMLTVKLELINTWQFFLFSLLSIIILQRKLICIVYWQFAYEIVEI